MSDGVTIKPKPKGGRRAGSGRKKWEPTQQQRETIMALVACGVSQEVISWRMGVSEPTIAKYCGRELIQGTDRVMAEMGVSLVREGLKGNVNAIKYFMQTRGGAAWRITEGRAIQNPDGTPLSFAPSMSPVVILLPSNGREPPEKMAAREAAAAALKAADELAALMLSRRGKKPVRGK